jgi:hypothetical protein
MKTINYKERQIGVPESTGDLPARKMVAIQEAILKYNAKEITIFNYNFIYLSTILDIPISELEDLSWSELTRLMSEVTKIITTNIDPKILQEIELEVEKELKPDKKK